MKRTATWLPMVIVLFFGVWAIADHYMPSRVIGYLNTQDPRYDVLRAPQSARVNQPFSVTVTTSGGSSCYRRGSAKVKIRGLVASITPIDHQTSKAGGCSANVAPRPRDVALTFRQAGQATIRVVGRPGMNGEPRIVEHRMTITP
jgi:hypothetical protein